MAYLFVCVNVTYYNLLLVLSKNCLITSIVKMDFSCNFVFYIRSFLIIHLNLLTICNFHKTLWTVFVYFDLKKLRKE